MKDSVLILGSGKMARNIGGFFLKKGYSITWLSRSAERLAGLNRLIDKDIKRISRVSAQEIKDVRVDFRLYNDRSIPKHDIIIESINESLDDKIQVISRISRLINENTLLLSNSSSILPDFIHKNCAGVHFFYPVEFTNLVEVIFPENYPAQKQNRLIEQLKIWQFDFIVQSGNTAFAVNRLLLPLQSEALRLLQAGYSAEQVNEASISALLPFGQLVFMDSVGLDVIYPAVCNYLNRMEESIHADYEPLQNGLSQLIKLGKLGKKNKNGFLSGDPLPWDIQQTNTEDMKALKKRFLFLFINSCFKFIDERLLNRESLDLILKSLFNSETSLQDVFLNIDQDEIITYLNELYLKSQISYFKPAFSLSSNNSHKSQK